MKKIIALFLLLIFVLCGCNQPTSDQSQASKNQQTETNNSSVTSSNKNTITVQGDNSDLLSVLYNERPIITAKGTTVYLKNYKPLYKYPEDVAYYEEDDVFVPLDYTFVDLDHDGQNELVISESPYAETYLILRKTDDKIYGYSLPIRWFQSLKADGTFLSSNGAVSHNYNTITFSENKYNISTFATFDFVGDDKKPSSNKFGFEPDYEKSAFEINGEKVSLEKIEKFAEEWNKRPEADWIKFK